MRGKIFLSSPLLLGVLAVVVYGAQQSGNPANSAGLLPQTPPSQNPSYSVWGGDQLLNPIEGPAAKARSSVRVLDEIEDPRERKAYAALFQKQEAQERRRSSTRNPGFFGKPTRLPPKRP
jgi:hypothetical protein